MSFRMPKAMAGFSLSKALTVACLISATLLAFPASAFATVTSQCGRLFTANDKSGSGWDDEAIAHKRFQAAIRHQNELRRSRGVPQLGSRPQRQNERGVSVFWFETLESNPDDPTVGIFLPVGESLIRSHHNDLFSLNHVYDFKGDRLLRMIPYWKWYLERHKGEEISLFRQMNPAELELWRKGKWEQLGRDWGYGFPVLHFSTDRELTTSASGPESPKVEIRISKRALMDLAESGRLWSGALELESMVSEFVLPAAPFKALVENGRVRVTLPR